MIKTKHRVASVLVTLALVMGLGLPAFAKGEPQELFPCTAHAAHNDECGFVAGSEGSPCPCTFTHNHDETCGWAEAVQGVLCGHSCELCPPLGISVLSVGIGTPGDVENPAGDPTVYQTVYFGTNPNDDNGSPANPPAPIMWRVLAVEGGEMFLLAEAGMNDGVTGGSRWEYAIGGPNGNPRLWLTESTGLSSGFTAAELAAISKQKVLKGTTVVQEAIPDSNGDTFFLLSEAEVVDTSYFPMGDPDRISATGMWWLRPPNPNDGASYVENDGFFGRQGGAGANFLGIRPACKLNLNDIILTSAAVGGKPTTASSVLQPTTPPSSPLKLTVRDDTLSCSAEVTNVSGKDITFSYEIAGACNRLAAIVQGENGDAKFYGYLKENPGTSGTATLTIPDGLTASDTLLVFAEQVNADLYTDYASSPAYMMMKDTPTGLSGVNCTTSANNDGKITGTTTDMEYSADGITWIPCTDGETIVPAPGSYQVRYSGIVNGARVMDPGAPTTITINPYTAAPTVGNITAPAAVNVGQALSLTAPSVEWNGIAGSEGWQISPNGTDGWEAFDPATAMTAAHHGQYLHYTATNSVGTGTSNTVQITVNGIPAPTPAPTPKPPPDPTPTAGSPQTGDGSNTPLWVLCACVATIGLTRLVRRRVAQR